MPADTARARPSGVRPAALGVPRSFFCCLAERMLRSLSMTSVWSPRTAVWHGVSPLSDSANTVSRCIVTRRSAHADEPSAHAQCSAVRPVASCAMAVTLGSCSRRATASSCFCTTATISAVIPWWFVRLRSPPPTSRASMA